MWLFTRWGFFSCVCCRQEEEDQEDAVDLQNLMVRSRVKEHIEALQSHLPDLIGNCDIREHDDEDFGYRICVAKSIWTQVMMAINQELDYDNLRKEAEQNCGVDDPNYTDRLHAVWEIMNDMPVQGKDTVAAKKRNR